MRKQACLLLALSGVAFAGIAIASSTVVIVTADTCTLKYQASGNPACEPLVNGCVNQYLECTQKGTTVTVGCKVTTQIYCKCEGVHPELGVLSLDPTTKCTAKWTKVVDCEEDPVITVDCDERTCTTTCSENSSQNDGDPLCVCG